MAYEKCSDVSEEIWKDFEEREPREITGRTGALYQEGVFHLPFLDRTLLLAPVRRQVQVAGAPEAEPGFRLCLTALHVSVAHRPGAPGAGDQPAGITRRGHVFPGTPRPAQRPPGRAFRPGRGRFFGRREKLRGEIRPAGDAAVALQSFPVWWWKSFYGRRTMSFPPRFRLPCRPTWTGSGSWMRSGAC